MRYRITVPFLVVLSLSTAITGQTIYWKKDHIYAGAEGREIAILTPPPLDTIAPTTPTGVSTSNVTNTSVQINWGTSTDSGGSGLAGYKIYRQIQNGASIPVGTVGPGVLSFVDQLLQQSTVYSYTLS